MTCFGGSTHSSGPSRLFGNSARSQLGRFLGSLHSLGLETVHQEAIAVIVVVETPTQVLPGRQGPVSLHLGRPRSPVDRRDAMIFHSGNGILSDRDLKPPGGIDYALHVVAGVNRLHSGEG